MDNSIDDLLPKPLSSKIAGIGGDYVLESTGSSKKASTSGTSSLSPAEAKSLDKQKEMAGAPILPPPQQLSDYSFVLNLFKVDENSKKSNKDAKLLVESMMMQATLKILSAWIESLREVQDYKDQASIVKRIQDRMQESIKISEKRSDMNAERIEDQVKFFTSQGLVVTAGMLAIGLGSGISSSSLNSFMATKEIGQIVSASSPSRFDDAISSLVGLFGANLVTQAAMLTLKSGHKNEKAYDYNFAKNYALHTMQIVNGTELDQTIQAVTQSSDLASKKSNLAKVALLGQTLAFSYRLETGSLSGQELAGMLKGEIKFSKDDFRTSIIESLQYNIAQIPAKDRLIVVEKLLAYYDAKPSLDELVEPANAIRSLFGKAPSQIIAG